MTKFAMLTKTATRVRKIASAVPPNAVTVFAKQVKVASIVHKTAIVNTWIRYEDYFVAMVERMTIYRMMRNNMLFPVRTCDVACKCKNATRKK